MDETPETKKPPELVAYNIVRKTPRVSSAHGRLQTLGEEGTKSLSNFDDKSLDIPVESVRVGRRTRSHSAPLTIEQTKVANELKRLSDALNFYYTAVKKEKKDRFRRHTFGSGRNDCSEKRQ